MGFEDFEQGYVAALLATGGNFEDFEHFEKPLGREPREYPSKTLVTGPASILDSK